MLWRRSSRVSELHDSALTVPSCGTSTCAIVLKFIGTSQNPRERDGGIIFIL
jgi:hypothetical protein